MGNERNRRLKEAIFSDAVAKKSYDELLARGLKNTDLLIELIRLAVTAIKKKSRKPSKAVAYFPVRLKSMAAEVEKLNTDPLYTPNNKDYNALPDILLGYAEQLQERRQSLQRSRKGSPGQMAQALKAIRWLVHRETGRESCALLKHILSAATPNSDFDFEAALKMNAHRYPLTPR
jgi:hypothetical protein